MHTLLPRSFALTGANLAAVPLVAVLLLGGSAGEIGLIAALQRLPFLLLSQPLGWMAERLPRRLMVDAELLRATSLVGLLTAGSTGWLSIGDPRCSGRRDLLMSARTALCRGRARRPAKRSPLID